MSSLTSGGLVRRTRAAPAFAPGRPAIPAEKRAFLELHERYSQIIDAAHVSGDASEYPTIFINDPAFDMQERAPDCLKVIGQYRERVDDILDEIGHAVQRSEIGLLSCMLASNLQHVESVNAWATVRTTATMEGHAPSPADLPDGLQPVEQPVPATSRTTPAIGEATIHGDYAIVDYVFGGWREHMLLRLIDDQWHIAGIWNSGSP